MAIDRVTSTLYRVTLAADSATLYDVPQVTLIGSLVSQLPLNPRMGRMVLLGCLFGCGPSVLSLAACMGYRDPFVMPATEQQRAQSNRMKAQLCAGLPAPSDQLAVLRAMAGFTAQMDGGRATGGREREGRGGGRNKGRGGGGRGGGGGDAFQDAGSVGAGGGGVIPASVFRYCDSYFLSFSTMTYLDELVHQLRQIMRDVNIQVTHARTMRNDGHSSLVLACVGAGLYPDVAVRRTGVKLFTTEKDCKAKIHGSSVNAQVS